MPIILSHLLPMVVYVPRLLPSMHSHFLSLIVTACCASLLMPRSVCFDAQYEYCQSKGRTCGSMNITYPFGVGNHGCGLPSFQINCVQNSSPVMEIHGQRYTILRFSSPDRFAIVRGENCKFFDRPNGNLQIPFSEHGDALFNIFGKENRTLDVYKCNISFHDDFNSTGGQLWKCNATVYYDFYNLGHSIGDCQLEQVVFEVGMTRWVSNDTNRDKGCNSCEASGGICGYNILDSTAPFLCYCNDGPRTHKCPGHGSNISAAAGVSIGAAVLIAGGLLVAIILYRRRKSLCFGECSVVSGVRYDGDKDLEAAVQGKIGTLPIFSYEVLKQATDDFDDKNQLGDGGFGSVYLGKLRDGRAVAVKRLYQENSKRVQQFINEVQILSISCHPNLVRLYGCTSPESRDLLLVYEYVSSGTLEDHLHGKRKKDKGLNWDTRLKICVEIARGLAFLHCLEPPIFHRDVKSPNILLDEDLHVKVADFGLSRFVPLDASHVSTAPQGTPGYVDPEYYECFQLTDKSDVYSFGVVLMEIISAKLAVDINRSRREIVLANMAIAKIQAGALDELIDPNLEIDSNPDIKVMVTTVAYLAFRCLAPEKEKRPDMKEVLAELEQIKQNGSECKDSAYQTSPISVHEKWPSTLTTPQNSASTVQSSL